MLERGPYQRAPDRSVVLLEVGVLNLDADGVGACTLRDHGPILRLDVCWCNRPRIVRSAGHAVTFVHRIGWILPTVIEVNLKCDDTVVA